MSQPAGPTLDPDAVQAICRHLNDDHTADLLRMALALDPAARSAGATSARCTGVDLRGLDLVLTGADGAALPARLDFLSPAADRAGVRHAVVALSDRCP